MVSKAQFFSVAILIGFLLVGDIAVHLVRADTPYPKVVVAQAFIITDDKGKPQGYFAFDNGRAHLDLAPLGSVSQASVFATQYSAGGFFKSQHSRIDCGGTTVKTDIRLDSDDRNGTKVTVQGNHGAMLTVQGNGEKSYVMLNDSSKLGTVVAVTDSGGNKTLYQANGPGVIIPKN